MFRKKTLFIIDYSRPNETLKSVTVDIPLEIEAKENIICDDEDFDDYIMEKY